MYLILGVTQGTGGCLNSPADNMNMAKSTLYGLHFLSDPKQHSHRKAQAVACKILKENAEPSASLSSLQATTHSGSFYGKKFRNSGEPQASLVCRDGQVHGIQGTIDAGTEETHQTVISGEEMAAQETEGMDYSVADKLEKFCVGTRREAMLKPLLTMCFCCMHSIARAENNSQVVSSVKKPDPVEPNKKLESLENKTNSRIYDATVIGEPVAIVKDKARVWNKLLGARVVYLGEAELVPDPDDKVIELEIVQNLRDKCFEQQRPISLALQAFPCNLQPQLNQYMSKRISDDNLKSFVSHWSVQRWEEYKPLLHYCCNNGVRLIACGTPLEILRTVQAEGVQALTGVDRRKYVPPAGAEFISNSSSIFHRPSLDDVLPQASVSFGPGSYLFAQARVVENYVMSQIVTQAMVDGGSVGLLVVVTGSTHIVLGSRGIGLPARVSRKMPKRTQAIVLLNPERQHIRKEGEVPVADFLWYSAAKPCTRNCFDRAEIARIMDAAGRRRDALPQDLQRGLDLGLVSPEVLQNFFDLDKQPFIAELTHHFQGFRERWLADPRFLQKLAIEESISITTTLIAQYERRKGHFTEELDYVITDTVRGAVVDFFTVWLPAPTLSFLSHEEQNNASGTLECLQGLLGSLPDNAFQRNGPGQNWSLRARITAVLIGGIKLFCVGLISSLGTVSVTNILFGLRQWWNPGAAKQEPKKRSPVLKTALVYSSFLGTSANLRYQAIAGIVEHWIADYVFASQPIQGNIISFLARTVNSYWGTQQWIDLARLTGLQQRKVESEHISHQQLDSHVAVPLEGDKNNATDGCDGSWTHKE